MSVEKEFMNEAIRLAIKSYEEDEVPVGAVVVKDNKIIGCGYNQKDKTKNPLKHAELIAIEDACKYVGADTFINKLDNKYEYQLQERGANFSSGQRQLISFARTIVHKPKIMILDEATSNIDTETEKLIQSSLNKMMNIGTMLIVAHRLSTIQHADKIIVLQKGEILESGTHQELLKKKGYYYNLYRQYTI